MSTKLCSFLVMIAVTAGCARVLCAQQQPDIHTTIAEFLKTWYVDRNEDQFLNYVAKDNALAVRDIQTEMRLPEGKSAWPQVFTEAFQGQEVRLETLKDAIAFPAPSLPPGASPLRYLNANRKGQVQEPFAIIYPDSTIPYGLLPSLESPKHRGEGLDPVARYLYRLKRDYSKDGRLFVVLYVTQGPGLIHETAVLYWILEGTSWKLALFQGTDW